MKIALLGYGIEGESAYKHLKNIHSDAEFVVYDQADEPKNTLPEDVTFMGGVKDFRNIDADLVLRTPAIRPDHITTRGKVTSVTQLFFDACPAPIIGVTGSKGKGTTSSLIASILRASGTTVHLVGNIGEPSLDVLNDIQADHMVVYELSSFQLWDLKKSPHVAVVLMIEPDHLDVHTDMDEYVQAKANIITYQSSDDIVVYNAKNTYATAIVHNAKSAKIPYPSLEHVHVDDSAFYYGDKELCSVDELCLAGLYHRDNACAAIAAVWPWVQDGDVIAEGLRSFHGLPHRLAFVREVGGVKYYDDTIATTPGAAIADVNSFPEPKVLILGGASKGADFTELAEVVAASDMRRVILMGEEANAIAIALDKAGVESYCMMREATMRDVVSRAEEIAEPGDVVILSPACASFGMFKNYKDRGEQFIAAVEEL